MPPRTLQAGPTRAHLRFVRPDRVLAPLFGGGGEDETLLVVPLVFDPGDFFSNVDTNT